MTNHGVHELVIGTAVQIKGRRWRVTQVTKRVDGMRLIGLSNPTEGEMEVELADLVRLPGFRIVDPGVVAGLPAGAAEVVAGTAEADRVRELVGHLLEVQTGYKSGSPAKALTAEPRPEFNPETNSVESRVGAKAVELGVTPVTVWRHLRRFRKGGAAALFDQRKTREGLTDEEALPAEYSEAVRRVVHELEGLSVKPRKQQVAAVRRLVEEDCERRGVPAPPAQDYRIQRMLRELERAAGKHLRTKHRNSNTGRSQRRGRGFQADAFGEQVLMDTWPLDLVVIDDETGELVSLVAVIALDVHTRAVLAADLYVTSERGLDVGFLLHELLLPRQWDPAWGPEAKWFYAGVPKELLVLYGEDWGYPVDEPAAHVPVMPTSLTVDQGRVYLSQSVMNVCHALGISVWPARRKTGSDKSPVERLFGIINSEFLSWYAAHRGRHVGERGVDLEKIPPVPLSEIRKAYRTYLMSEYPNTPRDGLRLPGNPSERLTPNQAVDLALQRQGLALAVPNPALIIDLLPPKLRTLTDDGVSVGHIYYWADVIEELRTRSSPYRGKAAGRFVVAVHPLDKLRAYIWHPWEEAWYPLDATNVRRPGEPMAGATDRWVQEQLSGQGPDWVGMEEARQARYDQRVNSRIDEAYTPAGKRKARRDAARAQADRERRESLIQGLLQDDPEEETVASDSGVAPESPAPAFADVLEDDGDDDTPIIGAAAYRPSVLSSPRDEEESS